MRYYITDIVGDGTEFNAFRPNIPDKQNQIWEVLGGIPTDVNGKPTLDFALVKVSQWFDGAEVGTNFEAIDAIGTNMMMPSVLDDPASARLKTDVATRLGARAPNFTTANTVRDIIREVGRVIDPKFDFNIPVIVLPL